MYTDTLYVTNIVVFLTAFSIRVSVLSSSEDVNSQLLKFCVMLCDVRVEKVLTNIIEKPLSKIYMIQSKLTYGLCVADLGMNTVKTLMQNIPMRY